MAGKVMEAVEKLFQFGTNHQRDQSVAGKDLAPVLSAVADALLDLDNRLKAAGVETARIKASSKSGSAAKPSPPLVRR
jgi:hypothetical protein